MAETTNGRIPSTDLWDHPVLNPWALEAIAHRGYDDYGLLDAREVATEIDEPKVPYHQRSSRFTAAMRAAIADALGVGVDDPEVADLDLDDMVLVITNDLAEPAATLAALDAALPPEEPDEPRAAPGASDKAYVTREGNWRARRDQPRSRRKVPPSQTTEARRRRHLQEKAVRLGIPFAEAEAMTPARPSATRIGRRRH